METAKLNVKFHNRFDIEVIDIHSNEVIQRAKAENIILDRMYTRLVAFNSYFTRIVYGTGSGTPTPGRTTLFNRVGDKGATNHELIRAFPVSSWTRRIRLEVNDNVGAILTEVGISETSTNINTHAMITDSEGNPLSIEKTNTNVIDIYATVFIEMNDFSGGAWFTGLRNYLAGGSNAPGSTAWIVNPDFFRLYGTQNFSVSTSSTERKRTISGQFSNLNSLQPRGIIMEYNHRKAFVPVTELRWDGVGRFPFTTQHIQSYDYVVTAEEAAAGRLMMHTTFDSIEQVLVNGVATTDFSVVPWHKYMFEKEPHDYIQVLETPNDTHNLWDDLIISGGRHISGGWSTTYQHGYYDLYSPKGFNFLKSYYASCSYSALLIRIHIKWNEEDEWEQVINLPDSSDNTVRSFHVQTAAPYLRMRYTTRYASGSTSISNWQFNNMPMLEIASPVLNSDDVVTIKMKYVDKVPKDAGHLLNASMAIQFGEGG